MLVRKVSIKKGHLCSVLKGYTDTHSVVIVIPSLGLVRVSEIKGRAGSMSLTCIARCVSPCRYENNSSVKDLRCC